MKTEKIYAAVIFLVLFCKISFSQPILEWSDTTGNNSPSSPPIGDLTKDKYGNVFITYTDDSVVSNIFTVKIKNDGTREWIRKYDYLGFDTESKLIKRDRYGNIYVLASIYFPPGNKDIIIIKYNASGSFMWVRRLIPSGFSASQEDFLAGAVFDVLTADKFMFIAVQFQVGLPADRRNNLAVFKIDLNSSTYISSVHEAPVGALAPNDFYGITINTLGEVFVCGSSNSKGFIIKYKNNLMTDWNRVYSEGNPAWFKYIGENNTGNLITAGNSVIVTGGSPRRSVYCPSVFKINGIDGSIVWSRVYVPADSINSYISTMDFDFDDNIVIGGNNDYGKSFVLKYSSTGVISWYRQYDVTMGSINTLETDAANNIYLGGNNNRLRKLNPDGSLNWSLPAFFGYTSKIIFPGSKIYILGLSYETGSPVLFTEVWKQSLTFGKPANETGEKNIFKLYDNYPNPFNPSTSIKFSVPTTGYVTIKVFDVTGKEVVTLVDGNLEHGMHEVNFNASNLASGVYFYKLISGNYTEVKKMVLVK